MAKRRLPRTKAPVYRRGYVQMFIAARNSPTPFNVITKVKNFLQSTTMSMQDKPKTFLSSTLTYLYVLNHNEQRTLQLSFRFGLSIELKALFFTSAKDDSTCCSFLPDCAASFTAESWMTALDDTGSTGRGVRVSSTPLSASSTNEDGGMWSGQQ